MKTNGNYQASICLSSKVLSAQAITDKLNLTPTEFHEKGTPFSKRSSKGKLREISSWILDSDVKDADSLESHIVYLISIIESNLLEFRDLVSVCKFELYCGFFPDNPENEGVISLSSDLLKRLTSVPIDITIVLYPPLLDEE